MKSYCLQNQAFSDALDTQVGDCTCRQLLKTPAYPASLCHVEGLTLDKIASLCNVPQGPYTGRCYCRDALQGAEQCGNVTDQLKSFCNSPTKMPIAYTNANGDGRSGRRVK